MRNENKIDFIVCYNNELYMNECIRYIEWLKIPEGMEREIIGVAGAESMAAGYNAAMNASNAKYKVYLHQDVFIINQDFISDVVEIFTTHEEYGLLGVIGSLQVVPDANYWDKWNVGITYACNGIASVIARGADISEQLGIIPVTAVDGMIMITQYDVQWREDVFDGFDFYDVSQSIEFQKAGYRVGIPHQKKVWCNHDCGPSNLAKYDLYRKIFCDEYKLKGYQFEVDVKNELLCLNSAKAQREYKLIKEMIEMDSVYEADKLISMMDKNEILEKNLRLLCVIFDIMRNEKLKHLENTFYKRGMKAEELIDKFIYYKFFLRRIENDFMDDITDNVWIEIRDRYEVIVDLPIIAETMCVNMIETLGKLYWKLYSETGRYYDFIKSSKVKSEIGKKEIVEILGGLENVFKQFEKLKGDLLYNTVIKENIKEIYQYIIAVDQKSYRLLVEDGEFHIAYYDMIYFNKNIELFFKRYRIWLDRMYGITCME